MITFVKCIFTSSLTMIQLTDFVKKMNQILDYYQLSAGAFADKIGVQRSSISHLLSGRNKPSLEFVLKIIHVFPEVDLYWFLLNQGRFPKNLNEEQDGSIPSSAPEKNVANEPKPSLPIDFKDFSTKVTNGAA